MALITGEYISNALIQYIEQWTTNSELKDIARDHDLSDELARKLARGDRKVTDANKPLVKDIIAKAVDNRNRIFASLQKTHKTALTLI